MTDPEFRDLVKKMRDAQARYFETRTPADLRGAKDYERRVDKELREPDSPGMFER